MAVIKKFAKLLRLKAQVILADMSCINPRSSPILELSPRAVKRSNFSIEQASAKILRSLPMRRL